MNELDRKMNPVAPFEGIGSLPRALRAASLRWGGTRIVFADRDDPDGDVETDVAEVLQAATKVSAQFRARGIGVGDSVAVQVPNTFDGVVTTLGVMLTGATLVPIVGIYGSREVEFILRESAARILVVARSEPDGRAGDRFAGLAPIDTLSEVFVVGDEVHSDRTATDEETADHVLPLTSSDDIAVLVYTSGTTAAPKGVRHSHRTLLAEMATQPAVLGARPDDIALACFPAGHLAGLMGTLRPILVGTATVVLDRWDAARAADLAARHGITVAAGTPFHLTTLLDAAPPDSSSLSSLREFLVGAATVPDELVGRAAARGIATFRCYGSTEHPTVTAGAADDPEDKRQHTDGRPLPGTEIRIVGVDGTDVPTGGVGEIWVRGPETFVGYRDPALDAESFVDGWLRTGDVGAVDTEGYLTVSDRIKDVIIRGGETMSSREIEDVLRTHPAIADVAVVGAPDDRYGERVCAFIIPEHGRHIDVSMVSEHVRASGLARQKTPGRVVITTEFPRTPMGKVIKSELRARL